MTTTTTTNPISKPFGTLPFAGFVFFNPWASCYTARKKITPADLGLKSSDLPPATLASLGSMYSCDPKTFQPFESYRAALRNACYEFGVRCMGGFAVPESKAQQLSTKLDEIVASFYDLKAKVLPKFAADREAWLNRQEFAQWTDKIRARLDSSEYVDRQLQAGWEAFVIGSTDLLPKSSTEEESPLAARLQVAASGICDAALDEISSIAVTVLRGSLHDDKGNKLLEVTQRILSPIRRIRAKLDALSFTDQRLSVVVKYIDSVLCLLPQKGKFSDNELSMVYYLVSALSNPSSIVSAASFALSNAQADVGFLPPEEASAVTPAGVDEEVAQSSIPAQVASPTPTPTPLADGGCGTGSGDVVFDDLF